MAAGQEEEQVVPPQGQGQGQGVEVNWATH